jgi:hypothetical protein
VAIRTIHEAVDRGVSLIDTAPVEDFGRSEERSAKALATISSISIRFIGPIPTCGSKGNRESDGRSAARHQDSTDQRQHFSLSQIEASRKVAHVRVVQPPSNLLERAIEMTFSPISGQKHWLVAGASRLPKARCVGVCSPGRMTAQTKFAGDDL